MASQNNTFDPLNMMKDWQMPNFDMDSMMQSQRKAAETQSQNLRSTFEAIRNLAQMQAQFANQWMETLRHASQQMATPGKWEDKLSQGTEIVKQNMHNAMNHMKQASAALADTTYKSVDAMMSRMDEHLDETVTMVRKTQNSKK
jgi:hypothetical protein